MWFCYNYEDNIFSCIDDVTKQVKNFSKEEVASLGEKNEFYGYIKSCELQDNADNILKCSIRNNFDWVIPILPRVCADTVDKATIESIYRRAKVIGEAYKIGKYEVTCENNRIIIYNLYTLYMVGSSKDSLIEFNMHLEKMNNKLGYRFFNINTDEVYGSADFIPICDLEEDYVLKEQYLSFINNNWGIYLKFNNDIVLFKDLKTLWGTLIERL